MYSQECTSILTQHTEYAISDYHIHNSVCMFELPLWAPAWHAFIVGAIHMHGVEEQSSAFSLTVIPPKKKEELEK